MNRSNHYKQIHSAARRVDHELLNTIHHLTRCQAQVSETLGRLKQQCFRPGDTPAGRSAELHARSGALQSLAGLCHHASRRFLVSLTRLNQAGADEGPLAELLGFGRFLVEQLEAELHSVRRQLDSFDYAGTQPARARVDTSGYGPGPAPRQTEGAVNPTTRGGTPRSG